MDDLFKIITGDLTNTSHAIKKDTNMLRSQTGTQIDNIDDTGKQLPGTMYSNMLLPMLSSFKAYLNRSMEIRDRISTVLDEVAEVVEEQENQIAKQFVPQNNDHPNNGHNGH